MANETFAEACDARLVTMVGLPTVRWPIDEISHVVPRLEVEFVELDPYVVSLAGIHREMFLYQITIVVQRGTGQWYTLQMVDKIKALFPYNDAITTGLKVTVRPFSNATLTDDTEIGTVMNVHLHVFN
jgi:hypothetical protein